MLVDRSCSQGRSEEPGSFGAGKTTRLRTFLSFHFSISASPSANERSASIAICRRHIIPNSSVRAAHEPVLNVICYTTFAHFSKHIIYIVEFYLVQNGQWR